MLPQVVGSGSSWGAGLNVGPTLASRRGGQVVGQPHCLQGMAMRRGRCSLTTEMVLTTILLHSPFSLVTLARKVLQVQHTKTGRQPRAPIAQPRLGDAPWVWRRVSPCDTRSAPGTLLAGPAALGAGSGELDVNLRRLGHQPGPSWVCWPCLGRDPHVAGASWACWYQPC